MCSPNFEQNSKATQQAAFKHIRSRSAQCRRGRAARPGGTGGAAALRLPAGAAPAPGAKLCRRAACATALYCKYKSKDCAIRKAAEFVLRGCHIILTTSL